MDRRELLKLIAALTGGAVVGSSVILSGCAPENSTDYNFTETDISFLDEVADTILPETDTPGAKAAEVGKFMTIMVNDCYVEKEQKIFHDGITEIERESEKEFNKPFMNLNAEQRTTLLRRIDKEAKKYQEDRSGFNTEEDRKEKEALENGFTYVKKEMPPHYFTLMKQLTLLGYFTSETGMTKAMRYKPIPTRYVACEPYQKGDPAYSS